MRSSKNALPTLTRLKRFSSSLDEKCRDHCHSTCFPRHGPEPGLNRWRILACLTTELLVVSLGASVRTALSMKRYVGLALCLLFLFAGIANVLGDCFGRDHQHLSEQHHDAPRDAIVHSEASNHDDPPVIRCPPSRLDIAVTRLSSTADTKRLLKEYRFYKNIDGTAHKIASHVITYTAARGCAFPLSLFQRSLSPHLFLSVLRI